MKREHNSDSYIEWLKSLGCLVYMPLSEEGDLQDRISGLSLQLTGNGSMAWDANEGMYKITQPTMTAQCVAELNNGFGKNWFQSNCLTVLQTIRKITSSTSQNIKTIAPNSYNELTVDAMCGTYNGSSRTSGFPDNMVNLAHAFYHFSSTRSYYQNGELYRTYSEYAPILPSNWILNGTGIKVAATYNNNTNNGTQFYMKNVYIFNTALDLATIRKIQGYE